MLIYVDMDHIGGGVEEDCESEERSKFNKNDSAEDL